MQVPHINVMPHTEKKTVAFPVIHSFYIVKYTLLVNNLTDA